MKTLSNNFTSQTVNKRGFSTIKLPNIRKPYTTSYLGLDCVSDAEVNTLYEALMNVYQYTLEPKNTKQEVINIMADAPHSLQQMFREGLKCKGYNNYILYTLEDSLNYMLDVAHKDFKKENATPRDINTYKRLKIVSKVIHFGNCFSVLNGSVTDDQGFELTEKQINEHRN